MTKRTKELVTIEFRYLDAPNELSSEHKTKVITIGIYDTFEEAIIEGNKALEVFEKRFKLNPNWNKRDRFSKNGGCFGQSKRLVTPLAYLITPFDFYAQITQLKFDDVEETINKVLEAGARYKNYKESKNNELE